MSNKVTPIVVTFHAKVLEVKEMFTTQWVGGHGADTVYKEVSKGWYVRLLHSYELLYIGATNPNIIPNSVATIRITFQCHPSPTTNPTNS